jgi:hypothetical protein
MLVRISSCGDSDVGLIRIHALIARKELATRGDIACPTFHPRQSEEGRPVGNEYDTPSGG